MADEPCMNNAAILFSFLLAEIFPNIVRLLVQERLRNPSSVSQFF